MEDVHREALRRNHSMLVREMSPELVAEKLFSDCILTLEMKEVVFAQLTRFAKVRKILEYLPRRGKKAFFFILSLTGRNGSMRTCQCIAARRT